MRFGIVRGDNSDSLVDIPIGDGSNDLRLRLEYFRDLGHDFDLGEFNSQVQHLS